MRSSDTIIHISCETVKQSEFKHHNDLQFDRLWQRHL